MNNCMPMKIFLHAKSTDLLVIKPGGTGWWREVMGRVQTGENGGEISETK